MEQHDIPLPPVVSPDVCLYETDEALLYSAFMPGVPQDEARVIFRKATMEFEFGGVWVPMPDEPQFRQVYSGNIKMHQGPFSVSKTVHLVRTGRIFLKVPKEYEDLLALPEEFEIQTEPREPEVVIAPQ